MDKKKFVNKIKEIEMPKDMQQRIIEKCYIETEKKNMNKMFKKPMVAVASFALCVCLMGVTALAAVSREGDVGLKETGLDLISYSLFYH